MTFDEGYSYSTTGSAHYHLLRKDDQNSVYFDRLSEVYIDPFGATCTAIDVHFANSEFQFEQRSFEYV
ncbi:hypothetical protein [uncultured Arthrobacter sp.]|uniref:hypothetical protein n=1 Tax=uncultured Arthrobacter sp. TaxID=114050 RepID=UPI0025CFED61|nr:hypothetical protein [uncultured Arthrobacter sp.]